ncbi:ThaI family type II restriction endonuclease [Candidatus Bathyarchaeota archaeon]|nr:ThaI family type II restriction endonuclease [Candidatus Bathyarchaeota archaeon]
MGRSRYFRLPKPGTKSRGVEVSKECLLRLMKDKDAKSMEIVCQRSKIRYNPCQRWVDYWREE